MRVLIGFALLALAALAGALLTAGAGAQQRSLALEERTPSSLTVTWSWDGPAAAFELAWRARGDDESTAWRTVRKAAADRRHLIENLDAGLHYVVRLRGLDAADRPIADLRGIFATSWSAPRLLRLLAARDGALTVGWSQPGDWNPHGWRLSWRVAGSQTPGGTIDLPAAARSRRIDGLSTATDYLVRLSALNARGGESPAQTIRATASAATLETPTLTALSWSGLTIRAEWQAVPRADGYDLFWRAAEERGGAVGRLTVEATSAEFDVPAGAYWVELRARRGAGRAARRSDRTPPRNIILRPAPHYLRVQSFDGEHVRLAWPGADVPEYDLEWGRGGTRQTETRDGRSGLVEVGPLEGGNTYEFRVRARNDLGQSGWSPTAALSPTIWPQRRPLAALDTDGSLYALWPPAAGAEWYEAQWVNAADPAETARVRVSATPAEGGGIAARIPRDGGFEDGRWLVRVRAGPWGTWSIPHALDLAGQPPRLSLALYMRLIGGGEFCTEAGMRELSLGVAGGAPPYTLTVEGESVDPDSKRFSVFCGLRPSDPQPCDPEPKMHQTFSATVIDSRGVTTQAELQVVVAVPPNRTITGSVLHPATASGTTLRLAWEKWLDPDAADSTACAHELRYQSTAWDADTWPEEWTTIDETIAAGATEYLHSGLDPERRYRYQVRALNNVGAGEWSRPFPRTAARPGAAVLTASTAASGSVALSWSAVPAGAVRWEYRQRPAVGGPAGSDWSAWTAIASSDALTANHIVTGLTEDARYDFQVRAVNAARPGRASATVTAAAGLAPPPSLPPLVLRYDEYDATGGATAPGGYAFLADTADLSSGIVNFADAPTAAALLVNVIGYSPRSNADFLNGVAIGDLFTWEHTPSCWFAYRITDVLSDPPAPARKLFAIELTAQDSCAGLVGVGASYDRLIWGPPPSEPRIGTDGIRILPVDYPVAGGHTYRLSDYGSLGRVVIDVPAGMRLIYTGGGENFDGTITVDLMDEESGAVLLIDFATGSEAGRYVPAEHIASGETRDVDALFNAIVASARRQPER